MNIHETETRTFVMVEKLVKVWEESFVQPIYFFQNRKLDKLKNMILQATELGISSCIISRGYETFDSAEGRVMKSLPEVPKSHRLLICPVSM